MAFIDLRAGIDSEVSSLDASEERGGIVRHDLGRGAMDEFFRVRERKSYLPDFLVEPSLEENINRLELSLRQDPPRVLGLYFHFLELYGRGQLSRSVARFPVVAGPIISRSQHPRCDFRDPDVLEWLLYLID